MTLLSDLIQRDSFQRDVLMQSIRKSVFWNSGVIKNDPELARLMKAHLGTGFDFDYFLDIVDNEGRISDDSNTIATTDSIGTDTQHVLGNYRNRSWGARSITASLSTTSDPMTAITSRIGAYWARQIDISAQSIITGVLAGNVANNASDMVNDQSGVPIDIGMILDAVQTAGDASEGLNSMICHSAIETSLKKSGVLDRIYDTNSGQYLYSALAGVRLIVTDSVPAVAGDYTSYLVTPGILGYGEGAPKRPVEMAYDAAIGNGSGEESIWTRKEFVLAPYGFDATVVPASTSPTNAEWEAATAFERKVDRKRVGLAALISAA